jgi:hypothetical protein
MAKKLKRGYRPCPKCKTIHIRSAKHECGWEKLQEEKPVMAERKSAHNGRTAFPYGSNSSAADLVDELDRVADLASRIGTDRLRKFLDSLDRFVVRERG